MGAVAAGGESGEDLRTLRRRRACQSRRDLLRCEPKRRGATGGAGNRERASRQRARLQLNEFKHSINLLCPRAAKSTAPGCRPCAPWRCMEFIKGLLVLAAALGVAFFVDANDVAEWFLQLLHISPDRHFAQLLLRAAGRLSDAKVWVVVTVACAYSGLRFVEAYGLWRARAWAEWVALVSGMLYLPFEIRLLVHRVSSAARRFSSRECRRGRIHVLPADLCSTAGEAKSPARRPSVRIQIQAAASLSRRNLANFSKANPKEIPLHRRDRGFGGRRSPEAGVFGSPTIRQLPGSEIPLARLPQAFDGFTIAQLSDFHYDEQLFGDADSEGGRGRQRPASRPDCSDRGFCDRARGVREDPITLKKFAGPPSPAPRFCRACRPP